MRHENAYKYLKNIGYIKKSLSMKKTLKKYNLKSIRYGRYGEPTLLALCRLFYHTVILTAQTGRSAAIHTNSNDPFCKIV